MKKILSIVIAVCLLDLVISFLRYYGCWASFFTVHDTFFDGLGNVQKIVAIVGLGSVIVTVFRYFRDRKKDNFVGIKAKIEVAKYNSTKECFNYYTGKDAGNDAEKNAKKSPLEEKYNHTLADSKALVIDEKWGYWGNDDKKAWIELDNVAVTVVKKPKTAEKAIKNPPLPQKKWHLISKKSYVKEMLRYGCTPKIFFNGDIYCASVFTLNNKDNKPELQVYKTGYFNFYNTCKVKEYLYEAGDTEFLDDDIIKLDNRACGIGVVTLTVIRLEEAKKDAEGRVDEKNNGLYFLMHKRGDKVAEGSGTVHVVPAGSFQPFTSFDEESSAKPTLSSTVYREFCEEILSTTDMRELTSEKYLRDNDAYQFINPSKGKTISKLYFLGLGLDPYNTKMEIMSLLYIDLKDENDFKKFIEYAIKNEEKKETADKKEEKNGDKKESAEIDLTNPKSQTQETRLRNALKKASDTEGSIVLEKFRKATLEEYFGNINIVPAAKELMYIAYKRFEEIEGLKI